MIYAATFLYLVANQTADAVIGDSTHALNLLGAPILAYMVYSFVAFARKNHLRNFTAERDLVRRGRALADANAQLRAQQIETRKLALVVQLANDSVVMSDPNGAIIWGFICVSAQRSRHRASTAFQTFSEHGGCRRRDGHYPHLFFPGVYLYLLDPHS